MRSQILAAILALGIGTLAEAQENIVYDTSPSTGRVVSIRVEENAPPRLPAVEIPENATSEDIARAIEQLASVKPSPSPSPVPSVSVTPRYGPRVRANDPVSTARDFMNVYGKAFGLSNPAKELVPLKEERDSLGMSHVRFKQMYKNIPVFGAEMVAHVGADGKVKSINGKVGSGITVSTRTRVSASKAMTIAKKMFQSKYPGVRPTVKRPVLYVYQPSITDNISELTAYVVWEVHVVNEERWIDDSYLIDGAGGKLVRLLDNVRAIKRKIYDCTAAPGTDICWSNKYNPEYNYTFGCQEGLCPHGPNPRYFPALSTDTDDMYRMMQDIHSYYQTKFNRNGANGKGGNTDGSKYSTDLEIGFTYIDQLSSMPDACLQAIYWPASGVGLCKGTVVPDFLGHEYAHGVNHNLNYSGETGALDESHSDLIGELFEFWLAGHNDWIAGSVPGFAYQKDVADPPAKVSPVSGKPYPDRFNSPNYYCGTEDNGGNHINSSVPSKAFYLLAEGGTFNGCSITAIGRDAIEQILYRAKVQYYAPSENFNGAYSHFIQACQDLFGKGASHCKQLIYALQSVELDQAGKCADPLDKLAHPASCQCEDSDDFMGEGGYLQQANLAGAVDFEGTISKDLCLTRRILSEYYCDKGTRRRALVYCLSECRDGVCI